MRGEASQPTTPLRVRWQQARCGGSPRNVGSGQGPGCPDGLDSLPDMRAPPVRWTLLLTLLTACTSSPASPVGRPTDSGPDSALRDASSDPPDGSPHRRLVPSQIPDGYVCEPTLESLAPAVFETSCTFDTCHGNNDAAWGLRLYRGPEAIAAAVIGEPAASCPGWLLVAPGDPERSFLLNKVTQSQPACGEIMPRGFEPLPDSVIGCLRDWITSLTAGSVRRPRDAGPPTGSPALPSGDAS